MRIALAERFQRDAPSLPARERAVLFETLLALPAALGQPRAHGGLGLRKLHPSGIWEARVGLGLRLVFTLEAQRLTLVRVGNHDEIKRYLREL